MRIKNFHSFLHHPENYGIIQFKDFEENDAIQVILLYKNTSSQIGKPTSLENGIENETWGLLHIIIQQHSA